MRLCQGVARASNSDNWMSILAPTLHKLDASPDLTSQLERAAVTMSLENLLTFPCVKKLVDRAQIALHGAFFGIAKLRNPHTGEYQELPPLPSRLLLCKYKTNPIN